MLRCLFLAGNHVTVHMSYELMLSVNLVTLYDTDHLEDGCGVLDLFSFKVERFIPECNLDNRFSPNSNSHTLTRTGAGIQL